MRAQSASSSFKEWIQLCLSVVRLHMRLHEDYICFNERDVQWRFHHCGDEMMNQEENTMPAWMPTSTSCNWGIMPQHRIFYILMSPWMHEICHEMKHANVSQMSHCSQSNLIHPIGWGFGNDTWVKTLAFKKGKACFGGRWVPLTEWCPWPVHSNDIASLFSSEMQSIDWPDAWLFAWCILLQVRV
jgi:hypothetical protein